MVVSRANSAPYRGGGRVVEGWHAARCRAGKLQHAHLAQARRQPEAGGEAGEVLGQGRVLGQLQHAAQARYLSAACGSLKRSTGGSSTALSVP